MQSRKSRLEFVSQALKFFLSLQEFAEKALQLDFNLRLEHVVVKGFPQRELLRLALLHREGEGWGVVLAGVQMHRRHKALAEFREPQCSIALTIQSLEKAHVTRILKRYFSRYFILEQAVDAFDELSQRNVAIRVNIKKPKCLVEVELPDIGEVISCYFEVGLYFDNSCEHSAELVHNRIADFTQGVTLLGTIRKGYHKNFCFLV